MHVRIIVCIANLLLSTVQFGERRLRGAFRVTATNVLASRHAGQQWLLPSHSYLVMLSNSRCCHHTHILSCWATMAVAITLISCHAGQHWLLPSLISCHAGQHWLLPSHSYLVMLGNTGCCHHTHILSCWATMAVAITLISCQAGQHRVLPLPSYLLMLGNTGCCHYIHFLSC